MFMDDEGALCYLSLDTASSDPDLQTMTTGQFPHIIARGMPTELRYDTSSSDPSAPSRSGRYVQTRFPGRGTRRLVMRCQEVELNTLIESQVACPIGSILLSTAELEIPLDPRRH